MRCDGRGRRAHGMGCETTALALSLMLCFAGPARAEPAETAGPLDVMDSPVMEQASHTTHARAVKVQRQLLAHLGLENGLPRDGSYARALALDERGKHADAVREYTAALAELGGFATRTGQSEERANNWRAKIQWQREQSEEILEQEAYSAIMPGSAMAHYHLARARHEKFLSARAFFGTGPALLWLRAREEYLLVLDLDPRHALARVGLAQLLANGGYLAEARRQFSQLGDKLRDPDLALSVAGYLAALGDRDAAFPFLARAVTRKEQARHAWRSNSLDPLRCDGRFAAVLAHVFRGLDRPE
ncbi:MAG: hypothetical protein HY698_18925 [Deltaproteobacteria bacterium]|nr:hypothetical protein [Deltaproteobacteria bacterium]